MRERSEYHDGTKKSLEFDFFQNVNFVKKRFHKSPPHVINVNFVKKVIFKVWIFWKKMGSQKCEFCQLWDFQNVIFVKMKREVLKMWILWKLIFWDSLWILVQVWNSIHFLKTRPEPCKIFLCSFEKFPVILNHWPNGEFLQILGTTICP